MPEMQTKTLQDRLRAAADTYSDQPPIFGLLFESADLIDTTIAQAESWRLEVEAMREATNRKLGEMREHNRAHIHDRERACMARDKAVSDLQAAETVLAGLAEAEEALRTVLQAQVASKLPQGLTYLLHFTAGFVAPHRPADAVDGCRAAIEVGLGARRAGLRLTALDDDGEDDAASSVQILDYSKPPPGYNVADRWSELEQWQREGCWAEYKAHNNPPGMWTLYWESEAKVPQGFAWGYFAEACRGNELTQAAARDAAWAWHDRRLALAVGLGDSEGKAAQWNRLDGDGPACATKIWPRCLTWSDDHVAEVERWLVDSTAEMPEVLRG